MIAPIWIFLADLPGVGSRRRDVRVRVGERPRQRAHLDDLHRPHASRSATEGVGGDHRDHVAARPAGAARCGLGPRLDRTDSRRCSRSCSSRRSPLSSSRAPVCGSAFAIGRRASQPGRGSEHADSVAQGRPLAAPRLPEALVGGDDQPGRLAGHGAGPAAGRDHHARRQRVRGCAARRRSSSRRSSSSACRRASGSTGCPGGPSSSSATSVGRRCWRRSRSRTRLDALTIWQLYVVGFLFGVLTVFFDVAYQSYLPSLVERDQLVDGNSKLEISRSGAQLAGPALAGVLIQVLKAPLAILLDAISFLASGLFVLAIRKQEDVPEREPGKSPLHGMRSELSEGLRYVLGHRYLRWIAASTASFNFFGNVMGSIFLVYAVRQLGSERGHDRPDLRGRERRPPRRRDHGQPHCDEDRRRPGDRRRRRDRGLRHCSSRSPRRARPSRSSSPPA